MMTEARQVILCDANGRPTGSADLVATLQPDGLGRYKGTITFADSGDRRVTVSWDGPAGKGATRFSVPVR